MSDPFAPLDAAELSAATAITEALPGEDGWHLAAPVPADISGAFPRHKLGKPAAHWVYRDAGGLRLCVICRFNLEDGRKEFLPLTCWQHANGRTEWRWKGLPQPRPLYGLDRLAADPAAPVLVTEGEKSADAAVALFPAFVTITSPNGARSAARADWSALAGRPVTIWPDHDDEGRAYAADVKRLALAAGAASVAVVVVPDSFPAKWDLADPLPDGCDADQLLIDAEQHAAATVHEHGPENPRPASGWPDPDLSLLDPSTAAPPAFDWGFVPSGWAGYVAGAAIDRGTPPDYVFAGVLAACATALGNARRVNPWSDWREPGHLWVAVVGHPSSGKTPAIAPSLEALKRLEKDEADSFAPRRLDHARAVEVAKATLERWEKDVKEAVKGDTPAPDKPAAAEPPDGISAPRLVANDTTTEALCPVLAGNPRGVLIDRDELAGWMGSFDRYSGAGSDRAFYLEAWNGGSFTVDRKNMPKPLYVRSAAAGVLGGIQPDRLREVLSGIDDGMAARFLYIWPEPVPPCRPQSGGGWIERREFLHHALAKLRAVPMGYGEYGPEPVALQVAEAGLQILDAVRHEVAAANRADSGIMAGWRGKNPGRLLRLALAFEFMAFAAGDDDSPPEIISAEAMAAAAEYLDYATAMMSRVLGELAQTLADRDAARIAKHIAANRLDRINERAISKTAGFHDLRDIERRIAAFAALEAAGWARRMTSGRTGRKPGDWTINPAISGGE